MESYEKVIIRLLPGDTPREKYLYLQKMAKSLLRVGFEIPSCLSTQLTQENFSLIDLQKIVKG